MANLTGDLAHLTDAENRARMAAGQLYHAFTPELTQERYITVKNLNAYNDSRDPTRRERVRLWRA